MTKPERHPNPYVERAAQWYETAPNKLMFSSSITVAIFAVAEYLANQDGRMLWGPEDKK